MRKSSLTPMEPEDIIIKMTPAEFENAFDQGLLDDEYMEYIQLNANPSERIICNGDTLLAAFEEQYLFNEFREFYLSEKNS